MYVQIRIYCSFSHVEGFYHDQQLNFFLVLVDFASWSDILSSLVQNFQNEKCTTNRRVDGPAGCHQSFFWYDNDKSFRQFLA